MKKNNNNNEKGKKSLRKLGVLFINFALLYALLRLIITLAERFSQPMIYYVGTTIYLLFGGACFVAFFILNGFTFNKQERTIDELPEKWSSERKMEFLGKQTENKAKARQLLYIILPMVVSIFISYIELTFIN